VRPVVLQLALAGFDVTHDGTNWALTPMETEPQITEAADTAVPMADVAADAEEAPAEPFYCPVCWVERTDVEDVSRGYLDYCPNCGSPAAPVWFGPLRG